MSPEQLVAVLNEIFWEFDIIADCHGLEKIKAIGDAYMAAAGLPEPVADHAVRAAQMALASRMESHGVAGRIQVTDVTRRLLGERVLFEERGIIAAKGIGSQHTWFLTGRKEA